MDLPLKLPYMTADLPGVGGQIRSSPEHFIVEEIPVFEPEGEGSHLFVNVTKVGYTTRGISRKLASLFGLGMKDIGYAGLKDKISRSTQTFSIPLDNLDEGIAGITDMIREHLPVTVNWAKPHRRKLRAGQLLGNRFTITITALDIPLGEAIHSAIAIAEELSGTGLPNYYGPQRVGEEGENLRRGYEIIKGRQNLSNRWLRRFLVSSYLSHLCNCYLTHRVKSGAFDKLLAGDIAKKHDTGGMFVVEDLEREQTRYEAKEISFTAPIYGPRMWEAKGPSGELEREIFNGAGISLDELRRLGVRGSRRLGRILLDLDVSSAIGGLRLKFRLPKGAYATTVLREIMKPDS
ncbi:MAG: tRNA pseudouridine(13) synthase TruD [Candidatus Bathyarchaeota archaeon]|jgi:tRNA pseudouridine13 synthase